LYICLVIQQTIKVYSFASLDGVFGPHFLCFKSFSIFVDMNGPKKPKKLAGENTGKVKKAKFGRYALVQEPTMSGLMKGDTIVVGNKPMTDGYIMGGDYKVTKIGRKKYK